MKKIQKVAVYFFATVAALGFLAMLGAENSDNWASVLKWGAFAFFGGTAIGCFLNDPLKYYRHVYGWIAVALAFEYVNFHRGGSLGKTCSNIKLNVHSYRNLCRFISDSAYYENVNMEDYN